VGHARPTVLPLARTLLYPDAQLLALLQERLRRQPAHANGQFLVQSKLAATLTGRRLQQSVGGGDGRVSRM
jgi:hypothetical protein